jgi:hypothetical protein
VGGQCQQRVILVHGNVCIGQDLKRKRIGTNATSSTGRIDLSAGYVTDWYCHDAILPIGNCTVLIGFVKEAARLFELFKLINFGLQLRGF